MRRFSLFVLIVLVGLVVVGSALEYAQGPAAPVAASVAVITREGATVSGLLRASDADGDALTFSIVTPSAAGTLTIDDATTGAFTYTPALTWVGFDRFTFQASDGVRTATAMGSVIVVAGTPRWPGQTVRASIGSDGSEGNASSIFGAIPSGDGRYIVFSSAASNLVPGDTNGAVDAFVLDRQTRETTRVSVASDGSEGNDFSLASDITPDGRYVAFTSLASNLVAGDTNATYDAFVHDRETGQTTRISVASDGTQGNDESVLPVLSADGQLVAFYGLASNLVSGDTNGAEDVFLRDRRSGQTARISVASDGAQGNSNSWRPSLSADGRFVAFQSESTNLVSGDVFGDTNNTIDVFVRDRVTGQTTRASVAGNGLQGNGASQGGISADGRYVTFVSSASDLVGDDTNGVEDVFVHDRHSLQTTRVSVSSSGVQGNAPSTYANSSADGRYVVMQSSASNLVADDTNGAEDVFVHDRHTGATVRISVSTSGSEGNAPSQGSLEIGSGPVISADGRTIVFPSAASNLVAGDTNDTEDIFIAGPVLVSPTALDLSADGQEFILSTVFTYSEQPATPWTATTETPWLAIGSPAAGAGDGTVSVVAETNTGPSRTGTLLVALQTVTVTQEAGSATELSVMEANGTFGGAATLVAILTHAGNPLSGQQISFALNGTPVGATTTDAAGIATLPGASLAGIDAGTYDGGVEAAFAGDDVFPAAAGAATLTVTKAASAITWGAPAAITHGAPLSSTQLNATANVPGSFAYTPPLGTLLPVGTGHTLSLMFTPADGVNYAAAQAQVTIDVLAPGPFGAAALHGIGDLPGGVIASDVRDATRVGGVLYAVGGAAANNQVECVGPQDPPGCLTQLTEFHPDTAVLWTRDADAATLTPLPDLAPPGVAPVNPLFAAAITRSGDYIASRSRSNPNDPAQSLPVRVTRNGLVNLNLAAPPFLGLGQPAFAQAVSDDGAIVSVVANIPQRALRFDVNAATRTFIPLLSPTHRGNVVAARGISFDGSVIVGTSFGGEDFFRGTNGRAFRYVHGSPTGTVSEVPLLSGGTWSTSLAVSPDGGLVLAAGNSTHLPNGEVYLYDATTGLTTALGSANTPWAPASPAGMTADGSVVAVTFADATTPSGSRHAYIRNANGWFHLTAVLAAQGIDLAAGGWESVGMQVTGISPDGTLVFGSGERNGNREGFVAEFSPGALASFDIPAVPPTDTSIIGVWTASGGSESDVGVFLGDGTYFHVDAGRGSQPAGEFTSGFERGRFFWDTSTAGLTFATVQDTNGSVGLSGGNGAPGIPASVTGDTLDLGNGGLVLARVSGGPGSVIGGWVFGDPRVADQSGVLVLLANGVFLFAVDGDSIAAPGGRDGVEAGTYTWTPDGTFTAAVTLDTNGDWGFGNGPGSVGTLTLQLSPDGLHLGEPGDPNRFSRIVDPQAAVPVITSPLSATAIASFSFAYQITATHADSFGAAGLPAGLSLDAASGMITGAPAAPGIFDVTISASNSLGSIATATLRIVVLAPTSLAVANAGGVFNGTATLSATLTSGSSPVAGKLVSFSLNGTLVRQTTTDAAGVATAAAVNLGGIAAGSYPNGVHAVFGGDGTHASSAGTAALTVGKVVPVITWPFPTSIAHGTPLGAAQLNATANVPGTFVYTPPAGTILPVGENQTLSVTFTPADPVNYTIVQAQVTITVLNAAPIARNVVFVTQEGISNGGNLQASDLEGDPLTFSIVTPPAKGTLTLLDATTGAFTYAQSGAAVTGYDTFTFRVTDALGASSTATGAVFVVARAPQWPGQTTRVSVAPDGGELTVPTTFGATPSADGRFIAFSSGIADETTGTFNVNVYVRDRQTGQTTLASISGPGGQAVGGIIPRITPDGRYVAFSTLAGGLPGGHPNAAFEAYVHDRQTGHTSRLNVATDGAPANGPSGLPALSADGRYAAFNSTATNLAAGDTTDDEDIYVRDLQTGVTTLASVSTSGEKGNAGSWYPTLSADGRYVTFQSEATNLVAGDTNGHVDLFVRDLWNEQTTRVSVASGGAQLDAGGGGESGTLSAGGRFVVFGSDATNAVPGDTNGVGDVFVRDLQTGTTTRVSVSSSGAQANGRSTAATITADGRFVAFRSAASNLVPGDSNGLIDDFVHDRVTGTTVRVNVAPDGSEANAVSLGDDDGCCVFPAISDDGRSLVITSLASNLIDGDTNNVDDVFVVGPIRVGPTTLNIPASGGNFSVSVSFDYPGSPWTVTTATPWLTVLPPAVQSGNGNGSFTVAPNTSGGPRTGTVLVALQAVTINQEASTAPVAVGGAFAAPEDTTLSGLLSASDPNGDALAFSLVTPTTNGTLTLTNAATGAFSYTPASNFHGSDSFTFRATAGGETSNIATVSITVTPVNDAPVAVDGTLAAIEDTASPGMFMATDADGDRLTFSLVSPPAHGTVVLTNTATGAFTYTPAAEYLGPDSFMFRASDGAADSNVATVRLTSITPINDAPMATDVVVTTPEGVARSGFLFGTDIDGPTLTFSIVTPPAMGTLVVLNAATGEFTYTPHAGAVGYDSFAFQVADGVASSTASGMVFIVAASPRWPGQTVRASVSSDGAQGDGRSIVPAISGDGRYIVFSSDASNLVPGDTNGFEDVFVHDRVTEQTTRVSAASSGTQGNHHSSSPVMSADGRYVAFVSAASNLVPGDANLDWDVFLHDRHTAVTTRVNVAYDGSEANGLGESLAITADGRYIAYSSSATNLVPDDTNGMWDVFVYDRVTAVTSRVSGGGGAQPNGSSRLPAISADGHLVAFRSLANNLVSGDTNGTDDVFVYDRRTGHTRRVSVAGDGTQGNDASLSTAISADGRYVAFGSRASNLVAGDDNGTQDIFVHDLQTRQTSRVSVSSAGTQANNISSAPSISADGGYVAFRSVASNLAAGDTSGQEDIFVHDRQSGETTRISQASAGADANAPSSMPSISADARFIAFESSASNLLPADSNGVRDVFVVGGVLVSPTTITVPAAGGSRSVAVAFDYQGTSWAATTEASWITIGPPPGGSADGTVSFTVAPNTGAARSGTLVVALHTVTVTQDAFVDETAPTVTPPADITVHATIPEGATAATVSALQLFLLGATAVDDVSEPVQQPATVNGIAITPNTVFVLGTNVVTFSFTDAAGNVGTATSLVTVVGGRPSLSLALLGPIAAAGPQAVTLRVSNNGTGNALGANVTLSGVRTLAGTGSVTLTSGLPASLPLLGPGQSFDIALVLNVPSTVLRFAMSEAMTMRDYAGQVLSGVATQTIFPLDVTAPIIWVGPTATVTATTMKIIWQTSEPATSRVDWGIGTSTNRIVTEDSAYKTSHSITITGLLPNTTYSYIVSGRDRAGNRYTSIRRTVRTNP